MLLSLLYAQDLLKTVFRETQIMLVNQPAVLPSNAYSLLHIKKRVGLNLEQGARTVSSSHRYSYGHGDVMRSGGGLSYVTA